MLRMSVDPLMSAQVVAIPTPVTQRGRYVAVITSTVWHCRHRHPNSDKAWDCAMKQLRRRLAFENVA